MVTKADIFHLLRDCAIRHDDKVTIHCSLRAIGPMENGADGLIDAFREYLSEGLFLVPTHTWATVNKANPHFDVRTSVPCIGTLPRVAAFRPDAVRTLHPTHSLAIFGKGAAEYARGEEHSATPAPMGSCLSRLYEENGKILLVGVGQERDTYLHAAEERFDVPERLNPQAFSVTILDQEGKEHTSPPLHNHCSPVTGRSVSDFYVNYNEAFAHTGAVTTHTLGNAKVLCCDARKMTDVMKMIRDRSGTDFCVSYTHIPEEYYK